MFISKCPCLLVNVSVYRRMLVGFGEHWFVLENVVVPERWCVLENSGVSWRKLVCIGEHWCLLENIWGGTVV